MKWLIAGITSIALAGFCLSIPAPVFSTKAYADRMNGKGNCSGGVCTQNNRAGAPSGKKSKSK
jgi:hypothetical protein